MVRIFALRGVSWVQPERPKYKRIPPKQQDHEEIEIACLYCRDQRARFRDLKHALKDGWRRIERWKWLSEPLSNYRGICPFCRKLPKEQRNSP